MLLSLKVSMLVPHGPNVLVSSTTFVTRLTAVHAGPTEPLKPWTTASALQLVVHSKHFYLLLTLPHVVMAVNASHLVAMVVKLLLHGLGSRELVLSLVVTTVMVNSALTTLCHNALITSLLKDYPDVTLLPLLTQFANLLAKPTLQLTTLQTKLKAHPATESAELITLKWR